MMDIRRIISKIEKDYIISNLRKEERIDGRGLWEYREFQIKNDIIASAEGSADVSLGDTKIITGLKYEVGEPFPDLPNEGVCTVMAHADCVQTKKLCIKEEELVYILFVDMYVINYAGNLIDAGGVSALTTLISAHIPEGVWNEDKREAEWTGKYLTGKDIVNELPFVVTYGKIDDIVFLDPSLPEELVCDGKISVSVTEEKITSIQKSGAATFSIDEIKSLGEKSLEIGKKLRKNLNLLQYLSNVE